MSDLLVGSSLGRYQILRKLADGTMAEIYLARIAGQAGFEKLVVVKRIKSSTAPDRGALAMFLDEARLAATLHHSNIAEVIDVGESEGNYFFAMEFVNGRDVRALRLAATPRIPAGVALVIVSNVASALAYAHGKTVVHRDISPSNIIVSFDGAVKLVDFGIARATSRNEKTLTGVLRGKVPYMSPEQCRGKVLDRRSDLFSLGIVLYELTLGVRPFGGKSEYEMLEAITHGDPLPPTQRDPTYPTLLEPVVMRLLERDPTARFQTADDFLAALEHAATRHGIFTSPLGIAKYMRELFADDDAPVEVKLVPTIKTPPPEIFHPHDDETTNSFLTSNRSLFEPMRRPRAPTETTNPEIHDFSSELEAELEADEPIDEAREQRAARRIETLVDRAFACYGAGELGMAITCVELALVEEESSKSPVYRHRATIMAIFEAFIGDTSQTVRLVKSRAVLAAMPEISRARPLVDRIDGLSSVDDLIVISGMSPLETYRQLCALRVRSLIELR